MLLDHNVLLEEVYFLKIMITQTKIRTKFEILTFFQVEEWDCFHKTLITLIFAKIITLITNLKIVVVFFKVEKVYFHKIMLIS